ncbi:hypothetical protein [Algoriphagus terrigena]|uniref:hypothetical protein n=1 Tax=Algoriphagus terrigena TaxID=344884 RepID=UPI000427B34C|nr:hypothetical protein [Algoriphagus terrigena]
MIENDLKEALESITSQELNGKNYKRSDFARSILNYPAMMVPAVQEPIIHCLSKHLDEKISLIDPFMGASNTLVTGMKQGCEVFGQDINPLSLLVSQVKTSYYLSTELEEARRVLMSKINSDTSVRIEVDFKNIDKWFKAEVQLELSKLRRGILSEDNLLIRKFFWVALAEVIRLVSNDRTSTFKLHVRTSDDIQNRRLSPIELFTSLVKRSTRDIIEFCRILEEGDHIENGQYKNNVDVVWGNSLGGLNTKKQFNLLVTSPPYGDNQTTVTYGQFSYLPLQWIPMEDIDPNIYIDYLKSTMEIDSNSLGGKMIQNFSEVEEKLFEKSSELKGLFEKFDFEKKKKAKKVLNFFHDMDLSIDNMVTKLKPGAFMVWTIGNRNVNKTEIKNDKILSEILQSKDIELVTDLERDILSKRMPGRNNFSDLMKKEKILIFKNKY